MGKSAHTLKNIINGRIITAVVKRYCARVSVQCKYCAFIPILPSLLNVLQHFATHHPRSINTASGCRMNNLFRAPCSPTRHFSLGLSIYWKGQYAFILLLLFSLYSVPQLCLLSAHFLTFICPEEGSCWACIPYSSLALLHFHSMLLFLLLQKMAVPLLLVSEQLLSILYKGTSVVVEEGLLDIHFQPAASQLLLKPLGCCCLAFSGQILINTYFGEAVPWNVWFFHSFRFIADFVSIICLLQVLIVVTCNISDTSQIAILFCLFIGAVSSKSLSSYAAIGNTWANQKWHGLSHLCLNVITSTSGPQQVCVNVQSYWSDMNPVPVSAALVTVDF